MTVAEVGGVSLGLDHRQPHCNRSRLGTCFMDRAHVEVHGGGGGGRRQEATPRKI